MPDGTTAGVLSVRALGAESADRAAVRLDDQQPERDRRSNEWDGRCGQRDVSRQDDSPRHAE
jgi:hypothetical protein